VPIVKTESALEEGEIINESHTYALAGRKNNSISFYDALTMILSYAAQNEHVGPFENYLSHSSTVFTPPYASLSAYSVNMRPSMCSMLTLPLTSLLKPDLVLSWRTSVCKASFLLFHLKLNLM